MVIVTMIINSDLFHQSAIGRYTTILCTNKNRSAANNSCRWSATARYIKFQECQDVKDVLESMKK